MPRTDNSRNELLAGLGIFLAASLLTFFLTADIFHPSMDEGIYLEGAHRILRGEAPYRDFFAYTGPLVYWVQAAFEAVFGMNIRFLRLPTSLAMGLTAAAIYWLSLRPLGWKFALGLPAAFAALRLTQVHHFDVNHRWLSTSLLTMGTAVAVDAVRAGRGRWAWCGAGALIAAAAWATPTYLVPLIFLVVWLACRPAFRRCLIPLAAGVALITLPAAGWLTAHGALIPMIVKLGWAGTRYRTANSVPYGYYPFAFSSIQGPTSWLIAAQPLVSVVLIPITLALGAWEVYRRRWGAPETLLLVLAFGMFLTSWPRWDVNLLLGVIPLFLVLFSLWASRHLSDRTHSAAFTAGLLLQLGATTYCAFLLFWSIGAVTDFQYFPTRVGELRNVPNDGQAMAELEQAIPAGSTAYVFPYMPLMGFMLRTENPTSYSYLQPGMMSIDDEGIVLGELRRKPPEFILRQYLPDDQVLEVWPNSDRSAMRFPAIENFINTHYTETGHVQCTHFAMVILRRRD